MPAVDAVLSCLNKNLTCPVDNVQFFRDPADRRLDMLLKASFALVGFAVQLAVAVIGIFQSLQNPPSCHSRKRASVQLIEHPLLCLHFLMVLLPLTGDWLKGKSPGSKAKESSSTPFRQVEGKLLAFSRAWRELI